MGKVLPVLVAVVGAVVLGACAPRTVQPLMASPLLGTWVEIITAGSANSTDGRQVIERSVDGTFKLVFLKTHPAQLPCTGTWSTSGSRYSMTFTSVSCFSPGAFKPAVGIALALDLVESSESRLRFNVPDGLPLAPWQAKLEGGIE